MDKRLLGVFLIFELRPDSESLWKSASDEPIRFGDKAIFRPKKLTWNLSFWDFWSDKKTPWCWGDLDKRLLGADSALAPRSLLSRSPQHQGVFLSDHAPIVKVPNFIPGVWSGQKTPWCWGDLGKRLLGARAESAPRSLLSRSPQHQGVFWPDQKSQKLKFQVSFLGLNIALSPNMIGSSEADFHKD